MLSSDKQTRIFIAAQEHAVKKRHSTEVWRWGTVTGYGEEIGAAYTHRANIDTATITENEEKQKAYRSWYFSLDEIERWAVDKENRI